MLARVDTVPKDIFALVVMIFVVVRAFEAYIFPVTWRFAVGFWVYTPTSPPYSVKTVVGQSPELVAPDPVCEVRSVKITVDMVLLDARRTTLTDMFSAAKLFTARRYVVPPADSASMTI